MPLTRQFANIDALKRQMFEDLHERIDSAVIGRGGAMGWKAWIAEREEERDALLEVSDMLVWEDLLKSLERVIRALGGQSEDGKALPKTSRLPVSPTQIVGDMSRSDALSYALAFLARKEKIVLDFRNEVMGGELIPLENIAEWVEGQWLADGPYTGYVIAEASIERFMQPGVIDHEDHIEFDPPLAIDTVPRQVQTLPITYPRILRSRTQGGDGRVEMAQRPVKKGGNLDRLRIICEDLQTACGWRPEQSVMFVLSDHVPLLTTHSAEVEHHTIPGARRLVLRLDPTLTLKEVVSYFEQERERLCKIKKTRLWKPKSLLLAVLGASKLPGDTWRDLMELWNHDVRDEAYSSDRLDNFTRDASLAFKKLVYLDQEVPDGP